MTIMPSRRITREKAGEDGEPGHFCTLELELSDRNGFTELSVCGEEGDILDEATAEKEAHESLVSLFAENSALRMKICDSAKRYMDDDDAADYVQIVDGRFHTLDVVAQFDGEVYVLRSCGQITEALAKWFPEVGPYLKWHLNGMHAGCEHQDALGWGNGKDIAITVESATAAQCLALATQARSDALRVRDTKRAAFLDGLRYDAKARARFLHDYAGGSTLDADEAFMTIATGTKMHWGRDMVNARAKVNAAIDKRLAELYPPEPFRSAIFKDCIGAPCPECGYRYGSAWTHRELPADVIKWAQTFGVGEEFLKKHQTASSLEGAFAGKLRMPGDAEAD